jgi:outer membrane protein assembly factor BamB
MQPRRASPRQTGVMVPMVKMAAAMAGLALVVSGCAVSGPDSAPLTSATGQTPPAVRARTTGCGPAAPRRAWAIDVTDSGRVAWQTRLPAGPPAPTPPPPLAAGAVAVFAQGGIVYGLTQAGGHRRWAWRSGQQISGMWAWQDRIVVLSDPSGAGLQSRLTGLDAATGAIRWVLRVPVNGIYGDPVATRDGGLALVRTDGRLEVVSLATGRIRWTRPAGRQGVAGAAAGQVLLASHGRLRAYADQTGRVRWTLSGVPAQPALQVLGGLVLVSSGAFGPGITTALTAVRPATGRVAWRFDSRTGVTGLSYGRAGLAVITFVPEERLYLLNALTGRPRWHVTTPVDTQTLPLVTATSVIAAEGGTVSSPAVRLVSRAAASGRPQWDVLQSDLPIGAPVQVGPDAVVQANPAASGPSPLRSYRLSTGTSTWHADMPAFVSVPPVPVANGLLVQAADLAPACPLA